MSSDSVFISYARRHRDEVEELIKYLSEDVDLDIWYDRKIRLGDFRKSIEDAIRKSKAMIVILTRESVGPGSSGWIEKEIDWARDSGLKEFILPCFIGDFVTPPHLEEKITFLQSVSCPTIAGLRDNPDFRQHAFFLRELKENRAQQSSMGFRTPSTTAPATWFASDPPPDHAEISLALATMLLEYKPSDLVVDTAHEIKASIERSFGGPSEEQEANEVRAVSLLTATQRFEAIGAERVSMDDGDGFLRGQVVRFKDRNWRGALLRHVWDELDAVREVLFDWMTERLREQRGDIIEDAIVRTLGSLAQLDLASLRHRLLDDWLLPGDSFRSVVLAALIYGSAAENETSLTAIRRLLVALANPQRGSRRTRRYQKTIAVIIAMGPLALRRPEIAIEVMKTVGRELFIDPDLRHAIKRSPAIFGQKALEMDNSLTDLVIAAAEPEDREDDASDEENTAEADDAQLPTLEEEQEVSNSRAVPATVFLAALADWADEAAPDENAALERQTPISALLHAFFGMPLLSNDNSSRLTLQDLMTEIALRDYDLIARILAGFIRAGMAKPRLGYVPFRDMSLVFRSFAQERAVLIKSGQDIPSPDPYLSFAGLVHNALSKRDIGRAKKVFEGSERWISRDDKAAIISGGPLPDWLERNANEPD